MTAICGHVGGGDPALSLALCNRMLEAQSAYGPHEQTARRHGNGALGRALFRSLPEDRHDAQPLVGAGGRYLLVADVRIDNRPELLSALRVGTTEAQRLSDAAVVLKLFEERGEQGLERLVGDFALALWDAREQKLLIARDPGGERPLHYRAGRDSFAFSTMPCGLLALAPDDAEVDEQRVAEMLCDLQGAPSRSFFKSIGQLQPGTLLVWTPAGTRTRRYWSPPNGVLRLRKPEDYVEAYREQIERATVSRLRRANGLVASHLSSGIDSSAVSATAAMLLAKTSERLLAFTSAPRAGFDGAVPKGRIADESGIAALTAARHPNIDHVVLRSEPRSLVDLLDQTHAFTQHTTGHVCNSHWWYQINEAAQERGATVMLTGEIGNLTISAGGLRNLGDLIRQGRWRRWLREARAIGPMTGASWRGVLAYSFGPWLSRPLWEIAMGSSLSSAMKMGETSLLAPGSANQIHDQLRHSRREARPPKNSRAYRIRLMESMNTGNFRKAALARWGIEERDPTADRRVIEFCLTLPDEMLLRNGVPRPLAREALSDRLPVEVIDNRLRGYQMADWYEQITRQSMCALFEQVKTSHQASAIIDFEKVRRKLETWPEGNMNDSRVIQEYRGRLLRTLATARFIQTAAHAGSVRCQSPQKAACRPGKPIGSLLGFS